MATEIGRLLGVMAEAMQTADWDRYDGAVQDIDALQTSCPHRTENRRSLTVPADRLHSAFSGLYLPGDEVQWCTHCRKMLLHARRVPSVPVSVKPPATTEVP